MNTRLFTRPSISATDMLSECLITGQYILTLKEHDISEQVIFESRSLAQCRGTHIDGLISLRKEFY